MRWCAEGAMRSAVAAAVAKQRHEEDPGLQVVQIRETLGERHHQEEREEHLHPGQYHPKLVK